MNDPDAWEPVTRAVLEEVDGVIERRLKAFRNSLDQWINGILDSPIPPEWRQELASFVERTLEQGIAIAPHSVDHLAQIIESRAASTNQSTGYANGRPLRSRFAADGAFIQSVIPNVGDVGDDSDDQRSESTGRPMRVEQSSERLAREIAQIEKEVRGANEALLPLASWDRGNAVPRYDDLLPWMKLWIDNAELRLPEKWDQDWILRHPESLQIAKAEIQRLTILGASLAPSAVPSRTQSGSADVNWRHATKNILLRYLEANRYQWIKRRDDIYQLKLRVARLALHIFRRVEDRGNLEMAGVLIGLSGGLDASPTKIPLRPPQVRRVPRRPPSLPRSRKLELRAEAEASPHVPEPAAPSKSGETTATAKGKSVHKTLADARRAAGEFDLVQSAIKDKNGNPILVSKRVGLENGRPKSAAKPQEAIPDAVSFRRKLIVDDKPLGRPIAKDRQEMIRNIEAYRQREGHLPEIIAIQRYDPRTGQPVVTEMYSPEDFLP